LPEPFFIHEGEITIWTQEQNLYCQFRIEEGDYTACSYSLMSACYLLDHHGLDWKCAVLHKSETLVYDEGNEKEEESNVLPLNK